MAPNGFSKIPNAKRNRARPSIVWPLFRWGARFTPFARSIPREYQETPDERKPHNAPPWVSMEIESGVSLETAAEAGFVKSKVFIGKG